MSYHEYRLVEHWCVPSRMYYSRRLPVCAVEPKVAGRVRVSVLPYFNAFVVSFLFLVAYWYSVVVSFGLLVLFRCLF